MRNILTYTVYIYMVYVNIYILVTGYIYDVIKGHPVIPY